jgi:hypothetical protein
VVAEVVLEAVVEEVAVAEAATSVVRTETTEPTSHSVMIRTSAFELAYFMGEFCVFGCMCRGR